jgi:L-ascorbate metabolism protein UlaG (beta-lactamase superfamily)
MPIGCYTMNHNHASPEETWGMFRQVEGKYLLATHWRTFVLSPEPDFEPMERLLAAAGGDSERIVCEAPGGVFSLR